MSLVDPKSPLKISIRQPAPGDVLLEVPHPHPRRRRRRHRHAVPREPRVRKIEIAARTSALAKGRRNSVISFLKKSTSSCSESREHELVTREKARTTLFNYNGGRDLSLTLL